MDFPNSNQNSLGVAQGDFEAAYQQAKESLLRLPLKDIHALLGELGLRVSQETLPSQEAGMPEAVPVTQISFEAFAEENGYSRARGYRSFYSVRYTTRYANHHRGGDPFPAIRWLDKRERDEKILDLMSVQERLIASKFRPDAWTKGTRAHVAFLRDMTSKMIHES